MSWIFPTGCCVLPRGVTRKLVADVTLDAILVILDVIFDYLLVVNLFQEDHTKWAAMALFFTFLPGIMTVLAMTVDNNGCPKSKMVCWHYFIIIFLYPVAVCWFAIKTLKESARLAFMLHLKAYEGLMEASFQFLIQLVIIQTRTPVGNMKFLGHKIENGDFWWRVFNTLLSFLAFIYGVCRYHCLLDKNFSFTPVIKALPFFFINILFRTFTTSLFFIYIRPPYVSVPFIIVIIMGIINMFLTYNTIKTTMHRTTHKFFTCIVGGIISILTPAFGCFYGEGAKGKTVKHFYKINIVVTNTMLIISFCVLFVYVNVIDDSQDGTRLLNRYPALGCHGPNYEWCGTEFGFPTCDTKRVELIKDFSFLGTHLEVRKPSQEEMFYDLFSGKAYEEEFQPRYMIAQLCLPGQHSAQKFNIIVIPFVFCLFILSSMSALFIEKCFISYKREDVEDEQIY